MQLGLGGGVQVGAGLEVADLRKYAVDRFLQDLGPVADAEEGGAHALLRPVRSHAYHRVVAVPPGELAERRLLSGLRQRKFRGDQQLARLQSRGVEALEEILRGDAPLALLPRDDDRRA